MPTVQPFAPWQDVADYVLAPDGGLENGGAGWQLDRGATVVAGNESFNVGGPDHRRSLSIAAGATATTAPMCIGEEHKTMRFFAKGGKGTVKVEVLYSAASGRTKSVTLGKVDPAGSWAPTDILPMQVNTLAPAQGNAMMVSFRFTANGRPASIDDVYVDPYRIR